MTSPPMVMALALSVAPERVSALQTQLRAALEKQFPKAQYDQRVEPGPLDLQVIAVSVVGAYPGTGVARVLVDKSGATYGVRGDKDIADLVRERGWMKGGEPDADTLVRLTNLAQYDAMAMVMETPAPTIARAKDHLTLTFHRTWHPSGGDTLVTVVFPASGKVAIEQKTIK